jgi:hypothetical protein
MDTSHLKQILFEEMSLYAGEGFNSVSYLTVNEAEQIYTIVDYATIRGKKVFGTVLAARLLDDKIVIDRDNNYPPLEDALKARGVPENQIVLAYRQDTIEA